MRIDLHLCSFKSCRYCFDGNCTKKSEYERCEYRILAELRSLIGDDYYLDRLKELVQADREGRCVVMPVKPGAHVYVIRNILTENGIKKFVAKMEVKEFIVNSLGNCYYVSYDDDHRVYHFNLCEFGKTVFLTSEEAEFALEKMNKAQLDACLKK